MASASVWAQEASTSEAEAPEASGQAEEAIPDPKSLGPWWLYSAKKYDPIYPKWLFHIEGNLSISDMSGNVEGSTYFGSAQVVARKNIFTNTVLYDLMKSDYTTVATGSDVDDEKQLLSDLVRVDLTERLSVQGGLSWVKDTAAYIENRYTYFLGLGYVLLQTPKHFLSVGAYGGFDDVEYTQKAKSTALELGTVIEDEDGNALYGEQRYSWFVTEAISFNEGFKYLQYTEDSDKYRWELNLGVAAQVIGPVAVTANYLIKYDNNPTIREAIPTYEKEDKILSVGIQVSY
jgi:putative salt-induced outer membrane protein YdiY